MKVSGGTLQLGFYAMSTSVAAVVDGGILDVSSSNANLLSLAGTGGQVKLATGLQLTVKTVNGQTTT